MRRRATVVSKVGLDRQACEMDIGNEREKGQRRMAVVMAKRLTVSKKVRVEVCSWVGSEFCDQSDTDGDSW